METTTKRVGVTLTFATDAEPSHVLASVVQRLGDANTAVVSANVYAFDQADDSDTRVAQFVIGRDGDVTGFVGRPSSAHALAEELDGVVVEVPVDVDCRTVTS